MAVIVLRVRRARWLAVAIGLAAMPAQAQFGVPWTKHPSIVVVGAPDDPRLGLVHDAVEFWNQRLQQIGSGFRLGGVTSAALPVPEPALQAMSQSVLAGTLRSDGVPSALRDLPGDLTIVLARSPIVSFAGPFMADQKRVVGIRSIDHVPLSLPNVARNVIAHELGHAIGLGHHSDPAYLMCGRPAPCRPDMYISNEARHFDLTDDDQRALLRMYPAEWRAAPR